MNPNEKGKIWTSWVEKGDKSDKAKKLYERVEKRPAKEFYDLKKDPYELNNLAQDREYANQIDEFERKLKKWMKDQGDSGASSDKHYDR